MMGSRFGIFPSLDRGRREFREIRAPKSSGHVLAARHQTSKVLARVKRDASRTRRNVGRIFPNKIQHKLSLARAERTHTFRMAWKTALSLIFVVYSLTWYPLHVLSPGVGQSLIVICAIGGLVSRILKRSDEDEPYGTFHKSFNESNVSDAEWLNMGLWSVRIRRSNTSALTR